MKIKSYSQITTFLHENLAFLEQEEAANNLIIGIPTMLQKETALECSPILLSVFDEDQPVLVCFQTPPRNLMMYGVEGCYEKAIPVLISFLRKEGIEVPGVIAHQRLAIDFAKKWAAAHHISWEVVFRQMIYRLDKLEDIHYSKGQLRLARVEDLDLVSDWMAAFLEEAMNENDVTGAKKMALKKIEDKHLYVWENEAVVTMAAIGRPTRHGITVSYVYTPPEFRKKGYASICVAELSRLMLAKYDFCTLFTDLANPTSNKIYARMGYRAVKEFRVVGFVFKGDL